MELNLEAEGGREGARVEREKGGGELFGVRLLIIMDLDIEYEHP